MAINRLNFLLKQAEKAAISRDFDFAEKILASQEVASLAGKDNPQILFMLGNLYMKAENFDKALSVFKRLNSLQPRNIEALNRLGTIYRRTGQYEKSLDTLRKAHLFGDNSAQLLYNIGNTYKEMYSYAEAEKCFMRVLELNPEDTLAYNHLGTIEFLLGHYGRAFDEYRNGLRIDPNHPFIHFNLARLCRLLNRNADSEREYIATLKSRPNWQKALKELASLYNLTGALEKQAIVLNRILTLDSANLPALLDSAENANKRGKISDARDFFQKAVAISENDPRPAERYSQFLVDVGEPAKAAAVLEAYNANNPQDKSLMLNLAELYIDLLRYPQAEKLLEEYSSIDGDSTEFLRLSAKMNLALGDKEKARQYLERIVSSDPGKIEMRKEFASLLAEAGLLQEAREQLEIFLRDNPEDSAAGVLLGAIYEQEGDFENALAQYAAVIEKEKDNLRANTALALLYQRMGKNANAVQLAGEIVNAQSAKQDGKDLSLLRESLELYEQAVEHYRLSNPVSAAESLRALARIKEELKNAAENALRTGGLDKDVEQAIVPETPKASEGIGAEEDDEVDINSLLEVLSGAEAEVDRTSQEAEEESENEDIPIAHFLQQEPHFVYAAPYKGQETVQGAKPANKPETEEIEAAELEIELAESPESIPVKKAPEDASAEKHVGAVGDVGAEITESGILEMLKYLKEALSFLPEEFQAEYRQSSERMIMEYAISRLSGKPGLHENDIAKSAYEKSAAEHYQNGEGVAPDLSETFSLLADLSAQLPDKDFAHILEKQVEAVQGRLAELQINNARMR